MTPHSLPTEELFSAFSSSNKGLTQAQARETLQHV